MSFLETYLLLLHYHFLNSKGKNLIKSGNKKHVQISFQSKIRMQNLTADIYIYILIKLLKIAINLS